MTARETNLLNAFETTLTGTIGASDVVFNVNSVVDSAGNQIQADSYLVLNPDSATNREVVLISAVNASSKQLTISSVSDRYLTGSAATSGLSHASGSVVRMAPLQQHIEDINDRVDTIINEAGTAVNTSLFLDEDDMSSNSATKGVTQQSVKAYVDTQLTAEDLDTAGNSGTGSVDLDSQSLTVSGDGTILSSTASGQGITFSIADASTSAKGAASFSSDNFSVTSGAVTIKDSGVSNDELAGSIANAKLANSSITVSDSESTPNTSPVALGGTLTFAGTANEVTVLESAGTVTISLPSSITVNVTGNVTGNVSGSSGSTTGNAATATALETARTIGGVSFDGTANIDLPGVNTAGNQNTSGNSATATALETARNIGGVSFDGTGNIDLPGVNTAGNQNTTGSSASTTGNAATATALQTARNIGGVSFDGTGNIDLPGVNSAGNQNTSGTAAGLSATLAVASGGTGATSMTDKAVVITQDSGTDTLSSVAMDANGELLIGGTSGPAVATLTAGDNITITNSDGGISIAASSGGGITEIDSFTITSNVTGNGDLTSNWQRSTASGFAKLGTGMAETGGIFTFPSTGFYEVEAIIFFESRSAAFPQIGIQVTTDNSSYSTALTIFGGERANQGGTGVTHSGTTFVDVTDTTQVKVKFTSANLNSTNYIDQSNTFFNFKKLGDT
tara:strand:+ start:37 stop:2079 length:2043 start_codon:yes stop_codon:yes gene_type:complete